MPLTFEEVSAAYKAAMNDKESGPLKRILADDFRWKMFARKDGASANKEQTVYWNTYFSLNTNGFCIAPMSFIHVSICGCDVSEVAQ